MKDRIVKEYWKLWKRHHIYKTIGIKPDWAGVIVQCFLNAEIGNSEHHECGPKIKRKNKLKIKKVFLCPPCPTGSPVLYCGPPIMWFYICGPLRIYWGHKVQIWLPVEKQNTIGHCDYFQLLAIMNETALNNFVRVFVLLYIIVSMIHQNWQCSGLTLRLGDIPWW